MENNVERTPSSVQEEIKRTRHKKELPLYIALTITGVIVSVVYIALNDGNNIFSFLRRTIQESGISTGEIDVAVLVQVLGVIAIILSGIGLVISLVVVMIISLYRYYGVELSYGVRVSENNFPENYEKVKEYTRLLGLKQEPEVFVAQENGVINAFTAWIPNHTFIQLNAEIVDLAYLEHKDFDTVFFVMAHEFGHVYLHHVQIYYTIWAYLCILIPGIGRAFLVPMLSRAREYSCDRVAQALTGGAAQEDCMKLLGLGRHIYKYADTNGYLADINKPTSAFARLARWIINATASHPIMPFRTAAVLDPEKKSGRLL